MNRLLAALLLLVWTASVGRCLAEQYGLLHEVPGLECCEHEHEHDQPASQPLPSGDPCGICTMIEQSGVSLAKPLMLASVSLLPVTDIAVPHGELNSMPVANAPGLTEALIRPPIRMRWGAYLVNTCLPARGPNRA